MDSKILELFPDRRLDYLSETNLRQAQLISLRILKTIDYICKKHNIQYWLDCGTLLGAVRHKGFIPWDDDVDIAMTRDDYNRFLEIVHKELPDDFFVQNFNTTPYAGNTWTQIKDRKSKIILERNAEYHEGIYVDIFPFDTYSDKLLKRIFREKIYKLMYIKVQAINAPLKKPYFEKINIIKNIVKVLLKVTFFIFAFFNYKFIYNLNINTRDKRIADMAKNPQTNYGIGTDVLNWDNVYKAGDIFPLTKVKFEDYEFSCPNNYGNYLKLTYGSDYMKMPPESKRIFHNLEIKPVLNETEIEELNRKFR